MPCPTCDHTMHSIGKTNYGATLFWCPRCGTIRRQKPSGETEDSDEVPMLPGRVVRFLGDISEGSDRFGLLSRAWVLGLFESTMVNPKHPVTGAPPALSAASAAQPTTGE